jgi:hypothetical protein
MALFAWRTLAAIVFFAAAVGTARAGDDASRVPSMILPTARAGDDASRVHSLILPELRRSATGRDWADLDAAVGEPPSPAHPRGTVVVAQAIAYEPSPSVTEWDVAAGTLVRSTPLPLPAAACELRIVRAGDAFHVVAAEGREGPLVYARLGRSLDVERVERIGRGERPRIATDGAVVALLWSGTRDRGGEGSGWQLVTLDARGARLGEARLGRASESTFLLGAPLAVAGGRVFVLLPGGPALRVVQLAADAQMERARDIPWSPDDGRLVAVGGRVLFTDDCRYVDASAPEAARLQPTGVPGRGEGGRVCQALDATADGSGRLVTTAGDVLDASLRLLRHFADPQGVVLRALWIHGAPALVVAGGPGGRAAIVWSSD